MRGFLFCLDFILPFWAFKRPFEKTKTSAPRSGHALIWVEDGSDKKRPKKYHPENEKKDGFTNGKRPAEKSFRTGNFRRRVLRRKNRRRPQAIRKKRSRSGSPQETAAVPECRPERRPERRELFL
jgi:hypothetical protein